MAGARAAAGLLCAALAGCGGEPTSRATIAGARPSIRPDSLALVAGQVGHLWLEWPGDVTIDATVRWDAVPATVATVDLHGVVRALAPGVATVRAHVVRGAEAPETLVAPVRVVPPRECLLGLAIDPRAMTLQPGTARRVTVHPVTCAPRLRVDSSATLAVEDTSVATVDARGTVTGRRVGITRLVARSLLTPDAVGVTQVTVTCEGPARLALTLFPLNPLVTVGDTLRLRPRLEVQSRTCLADAEARALRYASEDTAVARVGPDGLLRARQPGRAVVEVRSAAFPSVVARTLVTVREP